MGDKSKLRDLWETHPVVFIAGLLIGAFSMGAGTVRAVQEWGNNTLINKDILAELQKPRSAQAGLPSSRSLVFTTRPLIADPAEDKKVGDEELWNVRCRASSATVLERHGYATHGVNSVDAVRGERAGGKILGVLCHASGDYRAAFIYGVTTVDQWPNMNDDSAAIEKDLIAAWESFEPTQLGKK